MRRWMHRTCDTALAAREGELRESQTRTDRLSEQLDAARDRADRLQERLDQMSGTAFDQRLKHHTDREELRSALEATTARELALAEELAALRTRDGVLEQRRRRAAEKALGGAWDGPAHQTSGPRAQVAQSLLALPLASYDVTVTYERDSWGDWRWMVDGRPVNTNTGFSPTSEIEVLVGRYGFTHPELDEIHDAALRAHRRLTALTSKEF